MTRIDGQIVKKSENSQLELEALAKNLSEELSRSVAMMLEVQDLVSKLLPSAQEGAAVVGLQRLDLSTQSIASVAKILAAIASSSDQDTPLSERLSTEQIPVDVKQRIWPLNQRPNSNSAPTKSGLVDWL